MNIMAEAAIIFGLCLLSEGISAMLPFPFPASVISMVLLTLLLLAGWIREKHIQRFSAFLINNMAFFFLPTAVGILEHLDLLKGRLLPILIIIVATVPVVYVVTAWTVQLLLSRQNHGKEERHAE